MNTIYRKYNINTMNGFYIDFITEYRTIFIPTEEKVTEDMDFSDALENALRLLIKNGATNEELYGCGFMTIDEYLETDEAEHEEPKYIDLGYCLISIYFKIRL